MIKWMNKSAREVWLVPSIQKQIGGLSSAKQVWEQGKAGETPMAPANQIAGQGDAQTVPWTEFPSPVPF